MFTDSDQLASLIRSFAVHGKGLMKYDNVRIGMNGRLDAIQAAILQVKLAAFKAYELDCVNKAAAGYAELLAGIADAADIELLTIPAGHRSSWAQYTLKMASAEQRERVQSALADQNIPTMIYYPKPMHEQLAFRGPCIVPPEGYPVTRRLCSTVLSLPMEPYLSRCDSEAVALAVARALDR